MRIERLGPIITREMHPEIGTSINGATLIRVPDWVERPLGKYYLYFAHHHGSTIRLAWSDRVENGWQYLPGGVLSLENSFVDDHIASPEIFIDEENHRFFLYYHGVHDAPSHGHAQYTHVAVSSDGLHFQADSRDLGLFYWRVFRKGPWYYAISMRNGVVYRSHDGFHDWQPGPGIYGELDIRHIGLRRKTPDVLQIFYSKRGDCPEQILCTELDVSGDWNTWHLGPSHIPVMKPETDYEGAAEPLIPSVGGRAVGLQNQLRDPFWFRDTDGREYLLYSAGGEDSIAIARFYP